METGRMLPSRIYRPRINLSPLTQQICRFKLQSFTVETLLLDNMLSITATVIQWLKNSDTSIIADILRTVLQWISLHKAQGLGFALAAFAGPILRKFFQFVLDKRGCEIQIRGEDPNAEYVAAWVKQHCDDRFGTNQTAETRIPRPPNNERKCHQDVKTGYWRFDRAHGNVYTSYDVGYGSHPFLHQWRLWMYKRSKEQSEHAQNDILSIRCIGSWSPRNAQNFIDEAKRAFLRRESDVTQIFIPATKSQRQKGLGEPWTCIQEAKCPRDINTVDLGAGVKDDVMNDISSFLSPGQHQYYTEKGIRYGRNFLFHGPPGTGKTAFIEALSGFFGLPIYRISLRSPELGDDDLVILLSRALSRCFIVFEDIDQSGLPTRRIANDPGLMTGAALPEGYLQPVPPITLSGFLNAIDGVATPEGPIMIFTTNCLEDLDPAMLRPGRADRTVEIGLADNSQIQSMFVRIYSPKSTLKSVGGVIESKARIFADKVRDRSLTSASIQGFLLRHQSAPDDAIAEVEAWQKENLSPVRSVDDREQGSFAKRE